MWSKLPRWAKALIVVAILWILYRITLVFFPNMWMEIMGFLGLGGAATMMAGQHKALRKKEEEETEVDRHQLAEDRTAIDQGKKDLADLVGRQQSIPITTNKLIEEELARLDAEKKRILAEEISDEEAAELIRQRLRKGAGQ